jgi:dihydrofolate reductase
MIKAIFAVDYWGGMGLNGSLPWPHNREDLQYFKEQTEGHIVVMGRNTWDDPKMPKPLPNRSTFVVTNRPLGIKNYNVSCISGNIPEQVRKIQEINPNKNVWVIGGPEILMSCRSLFEEVHITHFKAQYRTDVQIDLKKFLQFYRITSAKPNVERTCNWSTYKNVDIFKSF